MTSPRAGAGERGPRRRSRAGRAGPGPGGRSARAVVAPGNGPRGWPRPAGGLPALLLARVTCAAAAPWAQSGERFGMGALVVLCGYVFCGFFLLLFLLLGLFVWDGERFDARNCLFVSFHFPSWGNG